MAFTNEVVVVTGANSGIGEAAAEAFVAAGAKVYATARREDALAAARARHPKIRWVLLDVRDPAGARRAIDGIAREAGRLDVLVNNAGAFRPAPLDATQPEDMAVQFETNVFGLAYVTQAALRALRESKGAIVNIGSAAGHKPGAGYSVYAATKAAVESLTRSWAVELAPLGIRVNAVAPGPVETAVFGKAGLAPEVIGLMKERLAKSLPLGRMATPEEIAPWLVAISDPKTGSWVTGQVLSVDGGMSLT